MKCWCRVSGASLPWEPPAMYKTVSTQQVLSEQWCPTGGTLIPAP